MADPPPKPTMMDLNPTNHGANWNRVECIAYLRRFSEHVCAREEQKDPEAARMALVMANRLECCDDEDLPTKAHVVGILRMCAWENYFADLLEKGGAVRPPWKPPWEE